jgi:glycosyltransferase involved in cell wall biosynthesis
MASTKLTILMPAYNAERYLTEAVDSLLNQTFREFELWVIDDASTDSTGTIAESLHDPRIRLLRNSSNKGFTTSVNDVMPAVQSRYFTITGADDVSHHQRLEKQIALLEADPELMMCGTSYWAVDEKGFLSHKTILRSHLDELRLHSINTSQFLGGTTIMRKEVWQPGNDLYRVYFSDYQSDADLACRLLDKHKVTNLPEPLYYYRILDSSVSRKNVSPRSLNLYKLIGYLSQQRRQNGWDCLDAGDVTEADEWLADYLEPYRADPSFSHRHTAFFHLYWGLPKRSILSMIQAIVIKPLKIKNLAGLGYIIFKSCLFSVNRVFFKKHYRDLI